MNAVKWLIKIWIFSMGFVYLFRLPYLGTKVQLPEVMVLLLAVIWVFSREKIFWAGKIKYRGILNQAYSFEGAALLFLGVAFLATLLHPSRASVLENIGYVYLFGSSLLVQWLLHRGKASLLFFQTSFIQLGVILAVLNMGIFVSHLLGWKLVASLVESKALPFLGVIPRVLAWMPSVNLLADLMALCWWMALVRDASNGKYARSLIILGGLLLTFSKSLLIILPLGLYLWIKRRKGNKTILLRSSGVLVLVSVSAYLFFTHVVVQPKSATFDPGQSYLTGEVLAETGDVYFLETTYLRLKKMQLRATYENPFLGVGPGNFNAFLQEAKEKGQYPIHLSDYDPHSTLGGTLAEMGILGFGVLLVWIFVIFSMLRKVLEKRESLVFYSAMACYLFFIGIEALTTDVLNFRHLWLGLGVIAWGHQKEV